MKAWPGVLGCPSGNSTHRAGGSEALGVALLALACPRLQEPLTGLGTPDPFQSGASPLQQTPCSERVMVHFSSQGEAF